MKMLSLLNDLQLVLPFFLYAETHYSFKGVYSRLKKKEPEIIADAPHRMDPGAPIPLMILMKDCDKFPVRLLDVCVHMIRDGAILNEYIFPVNSETIDGKYVWKIYLIHPPSGLSGPVQLNVQFRISIGNKIRMYRNDNYRISSHRPLDVYLSADPLPGTDDWHFGELHSHSSYTEDQAEFGAPLEPSIHLCKAMGLHFFAATDHSYDLDDDASSFLKNDPELKKWENFKNEVQQLNDRYPDFVVIPGEEVSAGNAEGRNVHLLLLNNSEFIAGKGDSAERWFHTKPDLSIGEVVARMMPGALAIAAHPEVPAPFLEWLLIRRGQWKWEDYLHPRLHGMQIWNGADDEHFRRGIERWVALLLAGEKLFICAGNDAHGNFNRFRQIGFPFWTFRESGEQIFGKMRTGVRLSGGFSLSNILKALGQGSCVITNGPFLEFHIQNERLDRAFIGESIEGENLSVRMSGRSSVEFGKLGKLILYYGDLSAGKELIVEELSPDTYIVEHERQLSVSARPAYLRAELISEKAGEVYRCLTNPVWIR